MLLEHERSYGFGMDALVSVCFWNTNGIMVLASMLWSACALEKHDLAAYAGGRAKIHGRIRAVDQLPALTVLDLRGPYCASFKSGARLPPEPLSNCKEYIPPSPFWLNQLHIT